MMHVLWAIGVVRVVRVVGVVGKGQQGQGDNGEGGEQRKRGKREEQGKGQKERLQIFHDACASGNRLVYIYNTLHPVGWLVCHVLLEYGTVLYCTRAISHRTNQYGVSLLEYSTVLEQSRNRNFCERFASMRPYCTILVPSSVPVPGIVDCASNVLVSTSFKNKK